MTLKSVGALPREWVVRLGAMLTPGTTRAKPRGAVSGEFDIAMVWVTALLVAVGLLMVYSSSIASASESRFTRSSATYFLFRQCLFVLIGAVLALFVFGIFYSIIFIVNR